MRETPDWFKRSIRDGLKALVSLRLDNAPSADTVQSARDVWELTLWRRRNGNWVERQDAARIEAAFIILASTSTRWPAPADLMRNLPRAPEPKELPAPPLTEAQKRRVQRHIAIVKALTKSKRVV